MNYYQSKFFVVFCSIEALIKVKKYLFNFLLLLNKIKIVKKYEVIVYFMVNKKEKSFKEFKVTKTFKIIKNIKYEV